MGGGIESLHDGVVAGISLGVAVFQGKVSIVVTVHGHPAGQRAHGDIPLCTRPLPQTWRQDVAGAWRLVGIGMGCGVAGLT